MWEQALEMEVGQGQQAESALYRSRAQFQGWLEKLPVGAYICDSKGLITYFNPSAVQLWGRTPKLHDPVDRFCGSFKLFSSEGLPLDHDQCWMALALKTNEAYNGHEIMIERPDGKRLTVLAYANPIHDESGKLLGAVNVLVDITERKQAELKERLLAEVNQLLTTSLDYKTTLSNLTQVIVPSLADWCVVDVIGEDDMIQRLVVVHKDPAKAALAVQLQNNYPAIDPQGEHTIARMMRRGASWFDAKVSESRLAAEARDTAHLRLLQGLGFASEMVIPLMARGRTLGALTLVRMSLERPYEPADLALAEEIARRAAVAIDNARLYEAEQKARIEAEATQQRLALLAEMRERNRLAQELHDTVAQALGYLNLKLAMTNTLLDEGQIEATKANLQELKNVVSETYTDVREEIFNLRAKVQSGMDFMEVLNRYIDKYRRFYKLDIQLVQEADQALFEFPAEVTSQLVRTIQEALINIRKHARVNTAIIRLSQENGQLCISIEDQGQGFDLSRLKEKTSSFGLQIMRERVESVGGSLEIDTAPGQSTRIILHYKA
jgi:PAS domain S-box-containing protein